MNYLSHHTVALQAALLDTHPAFFVGNLLPDLVAVSGAGRLRARQVHAEDDSPLAQGARLHFATDTRFHGNPAFADAMADAKTALLAASWNAPPARIFFLAHVFVEIALDGWLLRESSAIADDLYARLAAADLGNAAAQAAAFLQADTVVQNQIFHTLTRFAENPYLYHYATFEGQAEALQRLAQRAGVAAFTTDADRAGLTKIFAAFAPRLGTYEKALLTLPDTSVFAAKPVVQ